VYGQSHVSRVFESAVNRKHQAVKTTRRVSDSWMKYLYNSVYDLSTSNSLAVSEVISITEYVLRQPLSTALGPTWLSEIGKFRMVTYRIGLLWLIELWFYVPLDTK